MTSTAHSTAEAGPSRQHDLSSPSAISLHVPSSLLVLPPSAALLGMFIGMSRGGSRARLRFLAENAHRQPTTIQGWYFYTKTRNYRVFYSAVKTGAKYALALGGATTAYCLLDESVGWIRERVFSLDGPVVTPPNAEHEGGRISWRTGPIQWEDGAVAGTILGAGVGTIYRLPRPLFFRAVLMGALLGGATSGMQVLQARVGRLREEQAPTTAVSSPSPVDSQPSLIAEPATTVAEDLPTTVTPSQPVSPSETVQKSWWKRPFSSSSSVPQPRRSSNQGES